MTAFEFFIKDSLRSEHLNQTILFKLLKDVHFVKILTGIQAETVEPIREPEKGLFDLGLKMSPNSSKYLALIELKTDSSLSDNQAKRQAEKLLELKSHTCGVHIFIGLSDFEYFLSDNQDHLNNKLKRVIGNTSEQEPKISIKIGYRELIKALNDYAVLPDIEDYYREIAHTYAAVLKNELQHYEDRWKNKEDKGRAYFYAAYALLRKNLPHQIAGRIYSVGNTARNEFIINFGEWWQIPFEGHFFEVFHEINNGQYSIKALSFKSKEDPNCSKEIRKRFKSFFHSKFEQKNTNKGWALGGAATKYMKIATFKQEYIDDNVENTEYWAALISETHETLKEICQPLQ